MPHRYPHLDAQIHLPPHPQPSRIAPRIMTLTQPPPPAPQALRPTSGEALVCGHSVCGDGGGGTAATTTTASSRFTATATASAADTITTPAATAAGPGPRPHLLSSRRALPPSLLPPLLPPVPPPDGGLDAARAVTGVCPQFDVLWGCLTGREHLQVGACVCVWGGGIDRCWWARRAVDRPHAAAAR